jgi:thiamine kinase-like enzyme
MPPHDFVQARANTAGVTRVMVDGQPYLPRHIVAANAPPHKVVDVVLALLELAPSVPTTTTLQLLAQKVLAVAPVVGGLSNTIYRVSGLQQLVRASTSSATSTTPPNSLPQLPFDDMLVRIFGAEGMIDRDVETSTFSALASLGHVPPYYGRFGNGRLEGWIRMRTLSVRELAQPPIAALIATKVAVLHTQFVIPESLQEFYTTPSLWQQLEDWLAQALRNTYQSSHDKERAATLDLATIPAEFVWCRSILPPASPVVYCHNDLLAANIMYDDGGDDNDNATLQLIDFEYGGCNFRSFDLANHWNEYAGGPPKDTVPRYDWLPPVAAQRLFCRTYLQAAGGTSEDIVDDADVEALRIEVQAFMLPNHLYWGLWAINQAALEGCADYDYMRYGMERLRQYHVGKQEWLRAAAAAESNGASGSRR